MLYIQLLFCYIISTVHSEDAENKRTIAIELPVEYSIEKVTQLAEERGFKNLGQIGALKGHYLITPIDDISEPGDLHKRGLQKRSNIELENSLKLVDGLQWSELQVPVERHRRNPTQFELPTDPLFKHQWFLVSFKCNIRKMTVKCLAKSKAMTLTYYQYGKVETLVPV